MVYYGPSKISDDVMHMWGLTVNDSDTCQVVLAGTNVVMNQWYEQQQCSLDAMKVVLRAWARDIVTEATSSHARFHPFATILFPTKSDLDDRHDAEAARTLAGLLRCIDNIDSAGLEPFLSAEIRGLFLGNPGIPIKVDVETWWNTRAVSHVASHLMCLMRKDMPTVDASDIRNAFATSPPRRDVHDRLINILSTMTTHGAIPDAATIA